MLEIKDKQLKYDKAYLRLAKSWANLSHCVRKKVGAIIVKDGMIISDGFNALETATTCPLGCFFSQLIILVLSLSIK